MGSLSIGLAVLLFAAGMLVGWILRGPRPPSRDDLYLQEIRKVTKTARKGDA